MNAKRHGERTDRRALARQLMADFVAATGVLGAAPARRYLWTDAFAVCNLLGAARAGGTGGDLDLALRLVDQVHHVLGRHRPDDPRQGWISGLAEDEGERHPTRGGLRIGKQLRERRADDPFDERLEWERDGQYFHYLTQWIHALVRVSESTGQTLFHDWAIELAQVAHARFTRDLPDGRRRMVWKMSVDLRRVLVPSMGQHDPLDAWLTYLELLPGAGPHTLAMEIAEAATLAQLGEWATGDPLGIGALLSGLCRLALLVRAGQSAPPGLMERLLAASRISLEAYARGTPLALPAESRLAFRELGLAIGLHGLERLEGSAGIAGQALAALSRYTSLAASIDDFWCEPAHRSNATWREHGDINAVMLATSLTPEGYFGPSGEPTAFPHEAPIPKPTIV